jgi:hypothetical protein
VEELLFARGVIVTYEAIRKWCRKFGQSYANELRYRRPRPGDKWHLDEVFLTIHGERRYLWWAVDQDGNILGILVQRRRDKHAAKKFFRKLLKGLAYVPTVSLRVSSYRPTFPSTTASLVGFGLSARDAAQIRHLAGPHDPPYRGLRFTTGGSHVSSRLLIIRTGNKLTYMDPPPVSRDSRTITRERIDAVIYPAC